MKKVSLAPKEIEAHFRFQVIGGLLVAPLKRCALQEAIKGIVARTWICPRTGHPRSLKLRTVERWYYSAKASENPIEVLRPKTRSDKGKEKAISADIAAELLLLYNANKEWTVYLIWDNLNAKLGEQTSGKKYCPSYSSVLRYLEKHGLFRIPGILENPAKADALIEKNHREIATFECEYVGELFHTDAHHGRLKVLLDDGTYIVPIAIAIIDDCSRFICHIQWYLSETARDLTDCYSQAILRRGAPRCLMSDNGPAMISEPMKRGCDRLSIRIHYNPAYTPWKNGKMENFWESLEGQLVAMARKEKDLTLQELNIYTNEWIESVYHNRIHSETRETPLHRFMNGKRVIRDTFTEFDVNTAFMSNTTRLLRKSDRTFSLNSTRYEVPSELQHFRTIRLRFAEWNKRVVYIEDPDTGVIVGKSHPIDRVANSNGQRAVRKLPRHYDTINSPRLRTLEKERQLSGRPPAFRTLEHESDSESTTEENNNTNHEEIQ